jgi:tetratricopeptide (TPR) repeat protein
MMEWKRGGAVFVCLIFVILLIGAYDAKSVSRQNDDSTDQEKLTKSYRSVFSSYWSEDYQAAEQTLRKVLKDDPENTTALIYMADTLKALDEQDLARQYYQRALSVLKRKQSLRKEILPNVKEPEIYSDIVYCLNALGNHDEAIQFAMSGVLEGDSPNLYVNMAYSFFKSGQIEIAKENYCRSRNIGQTKEISNLTFKRISKLFEDGRQWIECPEKRQEIKKGTYYALIISVGAYKDSKLNPLQYAENDARKIYDVLTDPRTGLFEPENIVYLNNRSATRQEIEFKFDDMVSRAKNEEDVFFVFYAGHGFTYENKSDTYWLTYDTIVGNETGHRIKSTAFSNISLAQKLTDIKAKTVVLFLDACFSAGMVSRPTAIRGLETFLGTGKDYVIITSSQADQTSIESQKLKHGLFSYYLIKGLEGNADANKDGWVEIEELWQFVKNRVSNDAKRMGAEQNPRRSGSSGRSIILSKNPNL